MGRRRKLLFPWALAGLSTVGAGDAIADTADPTAQPTELSQVTVSSVRSKETIDQKREAPGVVDGISADTIQQLPSSTVSEVLTHITGISVTPNNDNERGRNTAQDPAIRGLDSKYNNITIDGLPLATANFTGTGVSSRATALDVLPATLVRQIEVFKTYSPDRDPQSIGGSIELTTRSAFDNGGAPFLQAIAKGGFNSLNGEPVHQNPVNYNADIIYSSLFGSERRFGLVVSADYERSADYTYDNATTDTGFYNFYNAAGQHVTSPALSNGYAVPQQSKAWIIEETNKKADVTTKLEFRPTDRLATYLTLGYYYDGNESTRNENILTPGGTLTNQTATTGSYSAGDVEVGGQYSPLDRATYNAQTGATWHATDRDVITFRAGDSLSTWHQPQYMVKFINETTNSPAAGSAVTTSPSNAFNYTLYDNYSNFNMNPAVFSNPNNYGGFYWRYRNRKIDTDNGTFKLDYGHNAEADSSGWGFKIGADVRQTRNRLRFRSPEYDPNTTGAVTLAVARQATSYRIPNYSNLPFLLINVPAAFNYLQNNPGLFIATNQNVANNSSNFDLREDTADGYGMLVYNTANVHAMAGVRSDTASVDVTGEQQVPNPAGVTTPALAGSPYPAFTPIRITSRYTNVLPAASISYAPVTTVQLRSAISKTVGRPDFSDYSPSSGISQDPGTGVVTITQGNPNLKPRLSTNYDVAAEWYFTPASMLSTAFFYKDIANEIFSITTNGTTAYNGATVPAITTEPVNASSSKLKGLEVTLVHNDYRSLSPWLEGVGTTLNYTLLSGSAVVPFPTGTTRTVAGLINQPKYIGNAILTYQRDSLSAALSYNRTGRSLRQLNSTAYWQDVYWSPHQQLDMKVAYGLARGLEATAEIQNLTDETTKSVTGPGKNLLKDISYVGRTLWFGLVFRPDL